MTGGHVVDESAFLMYVDAYTIGIYDRPCAYRFAKHPCLIVQSLLKHLCMLLAELHQESCWHLQIHVYIPLDTVSQRRS
jgi:hypothetical protein